MDYEMMLALILIVGAMALCGVVLRKQWADYCSRVFMKRSGKKMRRPKTHA